MIRNIRIIAPVCLLCLAIVAACVFGIGAHEGFFSTKAEAYDAEGQYSGYEEPQEFSVPAAVEPTAVQQTPAPEVEPEPEEIPIAERCNARSYKLSEDDRILVERIVMCEAGGEGEKGQMMVAQCINEGLLRFGFSVEDYIDHYQVMLTSYDNVTDEVRTSVSKVFDNRERVSERRADLWYNPAITPSSWHEEQAYAITVGSHRFFYMLDD